MQVVTKKDLTEIIQKALDFAVLDVVYYEELPMKKIGNTVFFEQSKNPGKIGAILCDIAYVNTEKSKHMQKMSAGTWAYLILDGKYDFDLDSVLKVIEECEKAPVMDVLTSAVQRSTKTGGCAGLDGIENELV